MALHEAKPLAKTTQLARKERRYRRKVASPKQWAALQGAKQGPCRVCDRPAPNELHHLIPRAQGGSDVEDNLVPLCREHHAAVESRNPLDGRRLAESLTDGEYAYAVEGYGEQFFERRLGVVYSRGDR